MGLQERFRASQRVPEDLAGFGVIPRVFKGVFRISCVFKRAHGVSEVVSEVSGEFRGLQGFSGMF